MAAWIRKEDPSRILMYEPASYGPRVPPQLPRTRRTGKKDRNGPFSNSEGGGISDLQVSTSLDL